MKTCRWLACLLSCLCLLGLTPDRAVACAIPVAHFALEHWQPDDYRLRLVHAGPAPAALEAATGRRRSANVVIQLHHDPAATAPRLELRRQRQSDATPPLWAADIGDGNLDTVLAATLDSPLRREVARELLERRTAVWILIEGDDRRANNAAADTLHRVLTELERSVQLPDPQLWGLDPDNLPRHPSFSVLRLSPDDPIERVFLHLLLAIEPDLHDFPDQPKAIPIFGRGRALHALVGAGINATTIRDSVAFLSGPCSCIVKDANPGVDLLFDVDWDSHVIRLTREDIIPAPTGLGTFLDRAESASRQLADDDDDDAGVSPP